jgi:hypothetical protein
MCWVNSARRVQRREDVETTGFDAMGWGSHNHVMKRKRIMTFKTNYFDTDILAETICRF